MGIYSSQKIEQSIPAIYQRLYKKFGPQRWWPAQSKFEVMVGAILTQNTNWGNVEKAIRNLKRNKQLSIKALHKLPALKLAALIKPAGYFNVKAKRLKNFIEFLGREYKGDILKMREEPRGVSRQKLLSVNGVGSETADSILLYALDKPVFVVDAYTKRFLYRHNFIPEDASYDAIQKIFMSSLKEDAQVFNEYHALIVRLGKEFCRAKALCEFCPLKDIHYSLIYKCSRCHRALPRAGDRKIFEDNQRKNYLCLDCRSSSLTETFTLTGEDNIIKK